MLPFREANSTELIGANKRLREQRQDDYSSGPLPKRGMVHPCAGAQGPWPLHVLIRENAVNRKSSLISADGVVANPAWVPRFAD